MTFFKKLNAFCLATLIAATPISTWADAGHDEGAPAPATGAGQPRFSAVSETFELVGVLNGKLLTLFLDRTGDNSPVKDATLELELDGAKVALKPLGEGQFGATLAQELKAGVTSVAALVIAGAETDLLAGELDIRAAAHADASVGRQPWNKYGIWLVAGLLALAGLAWGLRRVRADRSKRVGGAA